MALLAGAMCGVKHDSCSRKQKYARTSHGMGSESLSRGVDLFFHRYSVSSNRNTGHQEAQNRQKQTCF